MTTIKNFPEEVLRMVFEKLEHSDRTVCQKVCKAWYSPAHRLLLNNINLDNSVAILRFISSIDHNPDPRYLKSVRRICIRNSNAMDPLNRINFRKLFCRFPNLESVQIIHNFTLLHELNDEACKELLTSCTRLGEFEVIPNTIHRVQYVSLLKKIKTLVTTIYIDQCVLEQFGHPQQFIGDFPRLKKVCGDISSRLYNFGAFFPVLTTAPHLKRIMLDGVDEEEDMAETLLKSKRKQEREQISETLANVTYLNVNCRNGFSTNSVEFISKHMTGLENFHFVTKFNDSLVDLQHVKNILEIVNRAKEFGYFRLKKIQIDILRPFLPRIIKYTFQTNSTRKRVLHMKVLDRNDFDLVINSHEQRETTIEVTVKNERSIKKIMDYPFKVLDDFDKFILEFKKRKQTDRKDATTIQLYTNFLEKMPAIKELVADVPASYVEKETINYKFNRKYEGVVHENLESLTLRATENGNIQSMLNGFALAFPNLKDLYLHDYSGRWDETLGEFQLLLTGYSLKKLELDLAPVKSKMTQYLGDQAKQESIIIDVQISESGEQKLFEVTSDLVIAKKIEKANLLVGKDYFKVCIVVKSLQRLAVCMCDRNLTPVYLPLQ